MLKLQEKELQNIILQMENAYSKIMLKLSSQMNKKFIMVNFQQN